jgi:hypothetical protein
VSSTFLDFFEASKNLKRIKCLERDGRVEGRATEGNDLCGRSLRGLGQLAQLGTFVEMYAMQATRTAFNNCNANRARACFDCIGNACI